MKTYGLLGKNISYSFSAQFFKEKFEAEKIRAVYKNFDLPDLESFKHLLKSEEELCGLNVTIPYKEKIIPFLDRLDPVAKEIGAVNTIKFDRDRKLTGYNSDYFGFIGALSPFLKPEHKQALILGTGGASKAVAFGLKKLGIEYKYVSRSPEFEQIGYEELDEDHFRDFFVIVNCTPLGTFPDITAFPPVPTQFFTSKHLIFDLIYNPEVTQLMQLGANHGATVLNGRRMLELQALKAWDIWTSHQ